MAESSSTDGPLSKLRSAAERNPATQRLYDEAENYLGAQAHRLVSSVGAKLGSATGKITDLAEGGGKAGLALEGGKKLAEGKSPARAAAEVGAKGLKDKVKGAFQSLVGGGGGGKGKSSGSGKFNNIVEDCDVGVPLRVAYNQWTQYQDYSTFARGVLSVDPVDEVTSNWQLKVAKSKRSLKATVTEQIPDQRISWTTEGAKGTIKGVVTFHSLGENLTRILLVIEYYPAGFFEKTANMWWAASRRVRLDLKHYRRFVMMSGEETGSWRGEIRDREVVRSHEEVVEQEEQERDEQERPEKPAQDEDRGSDEDDYEDEEEDYDEDESDQDDEDYDDEDYEEDAEADYEDEEDADDDTRDESDEDGRDDADAEPAEQEQPPRRRKRPAAARSRGRTS